MRVVALTDRLHLGVVGADVGGDSALADRGRAGEHDERSSDRSLELAPARSELPEAGLSNA